VLRTVTFVCLVLCWALAAADPRERLDRFAAGLDSLSGTFHQVIFDEDGFIVEESHGTLKFMAPDRFRWDYAEPFPQQLVADGERLWHFDESLDQVTVRDQPDAAESPLLVLTRPELLDRFYRIEASGRDDELHFAPRDEGGDFERASLRFENDTPVLLLLVDRLVGQTTRLELSDIRRNPELDPADFRFEPPPGVDVLEGY